MKKVLFVINPVSGGINKEQVLIQIQKFFDSTTTQVYQTTGENDAHKIDRLLDQNDFDTVVAGGGDGTIAMIARTIKGSSIRLGILPLGSANGLAYELEIPMEPSGALKKILTGKAAPFDMVAINDQFMVHLADFGTNAMLIKRYQNDDHRGVLGYAISALKELPNLAETYEFDLSFNNMTLHIASPFVVIANAKGYGTGIIINPEGSTSDGKFEICCLEGIRYESHLQKISKKEGQDFHPFTIYSATEAIIQLKQKANFQIDGEYMGTVDHLDITILPEALHIIR